MTLQQDIIDALRDAANMEIVQDDKDYFLNLAARVENARCETCLKYDRFNNYCECKSWHMACGDICWDYQEKASK